VVKRDDLSALHGRIHIAGILHLQSEYESYLFRVLSTLQNSWMGSFLSVSRIRCTSCLLTYLHVTSKSLYTAPPIFLLVSCVKTLTTYRGQIVLWKMAVIFYVRVLFVACNVEECLLVTRIPPYHDFIRIWQLSCHSCKPFSGNCCVEPFRKVKLNYRPRVVSVAIDWKTYP